MTWYVRTGFSFLVLLYETWMQVLEIQNFRMTLKGSALVTLYQEVEADFFREKVSPLYFTETKPALEV